MPNYFKDQKLLLIFYHCPEGIPLEGINELCTDKRTGKSLVIAARGGRKYKNTEIGGANSAEAKHMRGLYDTFQDDIRYNDGAIAKKAQAEHPDDYAAVMTWAAGHTTDRLLVLACDDGEPLPEYPSGDLVTIRRGGAELLSEFLLSRFADADAEAHPVCDPRRLDGLPLTADETIALRYGRHADVDLNLYRVDWTYDFSMADNFYDLCEFYDELWDGEIPSWEEHERAVHNINQEALAEMHRWLAVPYELRKILAPEQERRWREELIPKIIQEHLDFIGRDLLGQPLDDFGTDRATEYVRQAGASWDSEMRQYLPNDD